MVMKPVYVLCPTFLTLVALTGAQRLLYKSIPIIVNWLANVPFIFSVIISEPKQKLVHGQLSSCHFWRLPAFRASLLCSFLWS